MPDWVEQVRQALEKASVPVTVCESAAIPAHMCALSLRQPPVTLVCPDDEPNAQALLRLAGALAERMAAAAPPSDRMSAWRQQLLGHAPAGAETGEAPLPCRVMALQLENTERAVETLRELTPVQRGDQLVEMDPHWVALITAAEGVSAEEAVQYAEALAETVAGETGLLLRVGISAPCREAGQLAQAWQEARQAVALGRRFHPDRSISCFERLALERFLAEQKPETCKTYRSLIFNRKTARLLNEEMLETINLFFQKDLNLSDTARQLFIHRNTLVYRLDKLQRLTGLDLRRFDDAVAFRVLALLDDGETPPAE